jgi:hypothetical protein
MIIVQMKDDPLEMTHALRPPRRLARLHDADDGPDAEQSDEHRPTDETTALHHEVPWKQFDPGRALGRESQCNNDSHELAMDSADPLESRPKPREATSMITPLFTSSLKDILAAIWAAPYVLGERVRRSRRSGQLPLGSGLDFELCIGALDDHGPENQRIHKPTTPKRPLKVENSSEFGRPGHGD